MAMMPNERNPASFKHLILLSKNDTSHGKELTREEEQIFSKMVRDAKKKEAMSWCEHKVFDTVTKEKAVIKPQGSRWVLTWRIKYDSTGKIEWGVKARLVVQGFSDRQGESVLTRSPTAARTAQRLLVSTCVLYDFLLSSIDISTAFLQGFELENMTTADGEQRKACMRPPDDFWEFCSQEELDKATRLAGNENWVWKTLVWNLLKPAYGLKDAPLLWILNLTKFLKEMTIEHSINNQTHKLKWMTSVFDESTFYLRNLLQMIY